MYLYFYPLLNYQVNMKIKSADDDYEWTQKCYNQEVFYKIIFLKNMLLKIKNSICTLAQCVPLSHILSCPCYKSHQTLLFLLF